MPVHSIRVLTCAQHIYRQVITNQREVCAVSDANNESNWQVRVVAVPCDWTYRAV